MVLSEGVELAEVVSAVVLSKVVLSEVVLPADAVFGR